MYIFEKRSTLLVTYASGASFLTWTVTSSPSVLFDEITNALVGEPGLSLHDFVCPGKALGVVADVLRRPDENPDCQRNEERQGVQKVEVTLVASQETVVAGQEIAKLAYRRSANGV